MKALYKTFFLSLLTALLLPQKMHAQAPTTGASGFSVSQIEGNRMRVNWSGGDGSYTLVVASESSNFNGSGIPSDGTDYNESSTLGSGDQIGSGNFVVYKGSGSSFYIYGLEKSTTYYFRIYEFNGVDFGTEYNVTDVLNGDGTTLSEPSAGPSNFTSSTTGNTASLTWSRGNGDETIVILQAGSETSEPTLYTNYSGSSTFGSGSNIGSGEVVYAGTGESVTVTNLQPNTEYFFRLIEANGNSGPVYNYTDVITGSFTTLGAPSVGSTGLAINYIEGNRGRPYFTRGDGSRRLVVVRQDEAVSWTPTDGVDYNANSTFGDGDALGDNTYVVANTTASSTWIYNLTPATTYHIAVFEFNGSATNTYYLTSSTEVMTGQFSTLEPPTGSASNLTFSNILGHQSDVSFTAGSGVRRIVLARAENPVTDVPVNLVSYYGSTYFTSAASLGDSKVIYRGTGTDFTFSRLEPSTTYHFAVYEYNGNSGPVYKQTDPALGSFTTAGKPTVAPATATFSNIEGDDFRINFSSGNGSGRIIIAKEGAPVDIFPVDGTSYDANSNFGTAATDLGNGNFVLANNSAVGNSSSFTVRSLNIGTTYHFAVIEYNGTGTNRVYMSSTDALTASQATISAPTIQATNLNFTSITANSVTINWDNGNGDRRLVLLRAGDPVEDLPLDLSRYYGSAYYPSSPALGSAKRVYSGTGNSVNVTNVPPGEYHVAVIEFNGNNGPVYKSAAPLTASVNVGSKPTVPAENVYFNSVDGNRMSIYFDRGDGISRLIIAKEGAPVDAFPVDFTDYTASGNFGAGSEIGSGNFVVASTTSSGATIQNLNPATTYHFAIVEKNGSGTNVLYQDASIVATASNSTLTAPEVPTSEFFANNVNGNSMELTWTRGDGSSRLILAREGAPVNATPTDLTNYNGYPNFGSGTALNTDNYGVYRGTGDNFVLSNLKPNTTYHFASFEYNGNYGKVYLTAAIGRTSFTTEPRPSRPSSNLFTNSVNGDRFRINFTRGNGSRRIIVLKKGGLVTASPEDLNTYTGGSFGTGTDLGDGNYVASITSSSAVYLSGFDPASEYGVAIFEFDGEDGNEHFLTTNYPNQMFSTVSAPDTPPQTLMVNSLGSTTANLSWTSGNGEGRMVVVRANEPVTFTPDTLNTHGSNYFDFSSTSTDLGDGQKHIRRGNITNVGITNLQPGTTYHAAIFEYNGAGQPVYNETALRNFFTTLPSTGLAIGGFDVLTFCPGQVVNVPYYFTGVLNPGNELYIELSDSNGDFTSATILGTQSTTNNTGFITSTLPASLPEETGYRLRVRSTSPAGVSVDNGGDIQVATSVQPTVTVTDGLLTSCQTPIELKTSQPGYLLQWFKDGNPIPLATGDTYIATESGDYRVRISGAAGGCQLFSDVTTLEISQSPTFVFPFDKLVCRDEQVDLTIDTQPAGGTFSGPGIAVASNLFDASQAGVGQHILTYTVDNGAGCIFEEDVIVRVDVGPNTPVAAGVSGCVVEGQDLLVTNPESNYVYNWYTVPTGGTPDATQTTAVFTLPALTETTSYYVSSVSPDGCESDRTEVLAEVTKEVAPIITIDGELEFCEGESVLLQGPSGFSSYSWSDGSITESITVTESGTYNLEVTTAAGCISELSTGVEVTVNSLPSQAVITSDLSNGGFTICEGGDITLTAAEADSYIWSNGESTQSITVAEAGTYSVTVSNAFGCSLESSEAVVTVRPNPSQPAINSDLGEGNFSICEGESITLTATEAASYAWSTGDTTRSIIVSEAGAYTVSTANESTCSSAVSEAIEVIVMSAQAKPTITSDLGIENLSMCEGETITLTASEAASYSWSTGETTQSITVSEAGTYSLEVENELGCKSLPSDAIEVEVVPNPSQPTISSDRGEDNFTICQGETITLTATEAAFYSWSNGETTQSITIEEAGSYAVTIENSTGCGSIAADSVKVEVNDCNNNSAPVISNTQQSTTVGGQLSFGLIDLLSDVDGNLDLSTLQITEQPISGAIATIEEDGILKIDYSGNTFTGIDVITISVCDFAGSCAEQQIEIEVLGEVLVYNAVSPNGDGQNEFFFLQFIDKMEDTQENQVIIYNRWGSKVFSISNYDNEANAFRGLNNNGNQLPSGIYYYEVQFKSGRKSLTGYLNLRR